MVVVTNLHDSRLILFYGAGSGAGKSTLSEFLYEQLVGQDIPASWLYEDDVLHLDTFAEFMQAFSNVTPEKLPKHLLKTTERFVRETLQNDHVVIADSIFPFFDWLLGSGCSFEHVADFAEQLYPLLAPLNPLFIYLDGDVDKLLARATLSRGDEWLERNTTFVHSWPPNREKPTFGRDELVQYQELKKRQVYRLIEPWPFDLLKIETDQETIEATQGRLLAQLGIERSNSSVTVPLSALDKFCHTYLPVGDDAPFEQQPLVLKVVGAQLHVNAYWPNGCLLVAEDKHQFRLRNTSYRVRFRPDESGEVVELTLDYRGARYHYQKVA